MKKELVEAKRYCRDKNIELFIFKTQTGDGWVSPVGWSIYMSTSAE